jgi:hypothetical protein
MSYNNWSDEHYAARARERRERNEPVFLHEAEVAAKPRAEQKVHPKMDPFKVTREARDSRVHPTSRAIGIVIDHTGSMQSVPEVLQANLPKLMDRFVKSEIEPHAQILISAVGDFISDEHPVSDGTTCRGSFQAGQFESGIEIDQDLEKIWRIGNGGPLGRESYQNALYFFDKHTSTDCFEKREERGFLFVIGDEHPYEKVSRDEVLALFGDTLQEDIPVRDVIKSLTQRYHVFFIIPQHTANGHDPSVRKYWGELLGPQNVLILEREEQICELITSTVGGILGTTPKVVIEAKEEPGVTRLG